MTNSEKTQQLKQEKNYKRSIKVHMPYVGKLLNLNKQNQTAKIVRRVRLAWIAFEKISFILTN